MNSNRGAKGSVNDRIISFLYRKRYLEYLKKKENYTKEERKRAIDYLKRIKEFDIDYKVDVLDNEDKSLLTDVYNDLEVKDFFKSPEKEFVTQNIEDQKGYSDVADLKSIPDNVSTVDSDGFKDLTEKSDKISEFNPFTEDYDFEKYDYYEVIANKGGVASEKEVIDLDKEKDKLDDEKVILEEVNTFIDESKEKLTEIKFELNDIKKNIEVLHTEEDVHKLNEKFHEVKKKLNELKAKYDVMKEKYEFEDYEILDNLKLIDSIEDYKDKASLDEIELMVDACKYEIEAIDGIEIEEEKKAGISSDVDKKHKLIKRRDADFQFKTEETSYVNNTEKLIESEMKEQQKIIANLDEQISKIKTETQVVRDYVYHTGMMFRSFLKISAGILTAPLSRVRIFNTMLGANLINHGLRDLRTSLIPEERTRVEIRYKYRDVEREILNAKDDVKSTMKLIDNSIDQIEDLKEYFKIHFDKEAQYIPNYNEVKAMMLELEKTLYAKKEEIKMMDNKLEQQYEKNKQKVLKANN